MGEAIERLRRESYGLTVYCDVVLSALAEHDADLAAEREHIAKTYAEHDAEVAALRERAERAEDAAMTRVGVPTHRALSVEERIIDRLRADRDRLAAELEAVRGSTSAARDAWWRERLTSEGAVEAAGAGLGYMRVGAGISLTDAVTDVRSALRAAIAHVLGSDGEAPKPEPAEPASPPLPEVPAWMRDYAENGMHIDAPHADQVARLLVGLIDALRAERGGR